ncbi:hypothetical protein QYF50_18785 [Paenibacillus vini]|uniref:DUF7167 family protein n=1 Tax=Paenibacillus vini TaxID=1476024 RepID=UPI0025B6687E|nr:hypothetical protein [Paenibacillus vini]MDN4069952.1 hypothetical protein [Paenibacillus vini]
MAMFKFKIYSRYVGADVVDEVEIPDEELVNLSEDEKQDYLDRSVHAWMLQTVQYGWEKVEE